MKLAWPSLTASGLFWCRQSRIALERDRTNVVRAPDRATSSGHFLTSRNRLGRQPAELSWRPGSLVGGDGIREAGFEVVAAAGTEPDPLLPRNVAMPRVSGSTGRWGVRQCQPQAWRSSGPERRDGGGQDAVAEWEWAGTGVEHDAAKEAVAEFVAEPGQVACVIGLRS